jgi:hypothetical protein
MNIKRWDWDRQAFVEDEYPETIFQPFLEWLFTTKAWIEDPPRVNAKVRQLERTMAEYRQPAPSHHEEPEPSEAEETAARINRAADLAQRRRDNLAKARAAKRAKREPQHA